MSRSGGVGCLVDRREKERERSEGEGERGRERERERRDRGVRESTREGSDPSDDTHSQTYTCSVVNIC